MREFIITYWLEFLFAGLGGIAIGWCKTLIDKAKNKKKKRDFITRGLKILLLKELERECNKYLDLGYIPLEDSKEILDELNEIYEPYEGLGGNGPGTKKYNATTGLPYLPAKEQEDE